MSKHNRYRRIVGVMPEPEWDYYPGGRCCCGHWDCPECGCLADDDHDDDYDYDRCDRCGGEGHLEYDEAGPDVWGEDCPSEENHLVTCPDCGGTGLYEGGLSLPSPSARPSDPVELREGGQQA